MMNFSALMDAVFARRYGADLLALAREKVGSKPPPDLRSFADALLGSAAETSGQTLAQEFLCTYKAQSEAGKKAFFAYLATHMGVAPQAVEAALVQYQDRPTKANYQAFVAATTPAWKTLLSRLNAAPGATQQLVNMRRDLLRVIKQMATAGAPQADACNGSLVSDGSDVSAGEVMPCDKNALEVLDLDFYNLFVAWFNRGFLVLRPISWQSPAHILEKIIAYEAVHTITCWQDLRRRLEPQDRRCFAFFHPAMPDEPLIFVEVALTRGVPNSVQTLLSEDRQGIDATTADTAVFYSISNCQDGLRGISFGNQLIKQVVSDLAGALPSLKQFVTLSPIPQLCQWLEANHIDYVGASSEDMRRHGANYLLNAKRKQQAYDPVARFHLGNGASVHALHVDADISDKGMQQSAGLMVNYRYDLRYIASNHERYINDGEVAASAQVKGLIK